MNPCVANTNKSKRRSDHSNVGHLTVCDDSKMDFTCLAQQLLNRCHVETGQLAGAISTSRPISGNSCRTLLAPCTPPQPDHHWVVEQQLQIDIWARAIDELRSWAAWAILDVILHKRITPSQEWRGTIPPVAPNDPSPLIPGEPSGWSAESQSASLAQSTVQAPDASNAWRSSVSDSCGKRSFATSWNCLNSTQPTSANAS